MRITRFLRRWWFAVSIPCWFAAFMTPGLTFLSFAGFLFMCGFVARPMIESALGYWFAQAEIKAAPQVHPTRKATAKRRPTAQV